MITSLSLRTAPILISSGILEEKPLFEGMIKIYDEAMSKGWGKKSKSAMFEVYQEKYRLASKKKG